VHLHAFYESREVRTGQWIRLNHLRQVRMLHHGVFSRQSSHRGAGLWRLLPSCLFCLRVSRLRALCLISPCVVGDCDSCCDCDCGATWDTSGTEIIEAAAATCNMEAAIGCEGTQPDALPFLYSDRQQSDGVCGDLGNALPQGLGPMGPATTEEDCERWAIASGGTYGGAVPADIYGCYREPASAVTTPTSAHYEGGTLLDPEPESPWYFSREGNGAPGLYSGGTCRGAEDTCQISTACLASLESLDGGRACCGCMDDEMGGECADACADVSDECQREANNCWDELCYTYDRCEENDCSQGCYQWGYCTDCTWSLSVSLSACDCLSV
jgi:hypothetical protein